MITPKLTRAAPGFESEVRALPFFCCGFLEMIFMKIAGWNSGLTSAAESLQVCVGCRDQGARGEFEDLLDQCRAGESVGRDRDASGLDRYQVRLVCPKLLRRSCLRLSCSSFSCTEGGPAERGESFNAPPDFVSCELPSLLRHFRLYCRDRNRSIRRNL